MKFCKTLLALTIALVSMASCSEKTDSNEQMNNYVTLSVEGESAMTEDNTEGLVVNVSMAYTLDHDASVQLSLTGDEKEAVKLSSNKVTIPAGKKTASVKVLSNNANVLSIQEVVNVVVSSCSDANMKPMDTKGIALTIKPNAMVPELTAEQLALIKGYKDNLGIDLTKVLGIVDVTTTVTYGNDDKDAENKGNDTRVFNGKSVITLSDKATADKPVLKMISNPMGMESYMYDRLLRCTTEEPDGYFDADPINTALLSVVNYNKSTESFSAVLDNITLNTDGTLNFTAVEDDKTIVPFEYTYSVWTRINEMANAGNTVNVNEGSTYVEYSIKDLLEQYSTFCPAKYLGNTDITIDAYGATPSNFVLPSAKYDFNNNTMSFDFAWDYGNGSYLNDYVRIKANYTMHK
jgi:hypothetical protein